MNSSLRNMRMFIFLLIALFSGSLNAQVTTLWQKSQLNGNLPSFIGTANNERGIAYGNVGGNHRLYVATVTGGAKVVILDAATGDSLGTLTGVGISGGTFTLTDVEVSTDGVVFGCNLVTSTAVATPFKIYRWNSESTDSARVVATWTTGAYRLGDKFTVTGSTADNSIAIWAVAASNNKLVKFTTTDNGVTFTGQEIVITGLASGNSATAAPLNGGADGYWIKGGGAQLRRVKGDLSLYTAVDANLVPTGSNAMKYFEVGGRKFIAMFFNGNAVTTTSTTAFFERVRILEVINDSVAAPVAFTPMLGTNSNTNGTGDVAIRDAGSGNYVIYAFSTNNGIGAYNFNSTTANTIITPPHTQDFASYFPPDNWYRLTGNQGTPLTTVTSTWVTDDFGNVLSPVNRSTKVNIFGSTLKHWWVSPQINLGTGTPDIQLEFDLALTKFGAVTADTLGVDDTLAVFLSTDNGATWTTKLKEWTSASPLISNTGQHEVIDLSAYTGNVRIAFYAVSSVSNKDNDVFIDNFQVREIPATPIFSVNPTSKDFGSLQTGTQSAAQTFTLSNTGGGTLTISGVAKSGTNAASFVLTDNNTYPKNLAANESMTFTVAFAPADTGAKTASIDITHNAAGSPNALALTGVGVDFTITNFPYFQNFDSTGGVFPPPGWLNINNYWARGTEANSLPYCAKVSYNYSGTIPAILQSPPVNLPPFSKISFWWKDDDITKSIENDPELVEKQFALGPNVALHDTTFFEISTDGGTTWTTLAFLSAGAPQTAYSEQVVDLAAFAGNGRFLRWRDKTNASFSAYGTGLDDIKIEVVPQIMLDWYNLQWPLTATISEGGSATVYAQAYEGGVTPNPADTTIKCWIGYSSTNTDPSTWTNWVAATFNVVSGNNNEYKADIGANLSAGTYYYASRFQLLNGPYTYGGASGSNGGPWNGTTNISGVLTVNPVVINQFPMSEGFEGNFPPTGWKVVDINGGTTWNQSNVKPRTGLYSARYNYSTSLPGNDWLITPALALQAGKTYRVAYGYSARSASFAENLKVAIGSANVPDSLYTVLADHPNITAITYQVGNAPFTIPVSGNYYIGFHAYSLADKFDLFVDDVYITEVPPVDLAVLSVGQLNGIPMPTEADASALVKGAETTPIDPASLVNGKESGLVNSNPTVGNNITGGSSLVTGEDLDGIVPVQMRTFIGNAGLNAAEYVLNYTIAGVQGAPVNRPSLPAGSVDTVNFGSTPENRGTFTTTVAVTAAGDTINAANNTLAYYRTLVYPDSAYHVRYDNGPNTPSTFIGFGTNNIQVWAAVRMTAPVNMKLANIDAFYRNEASNDSVMVGIWGAGADSLAPGPLLYMKKFGGENYVVPGTGGDYVTLPLGTDAPGFQVGQTFWVSMTFSSAIQYPLGAHNSPLTNPGRSFISQDSGKTWFPLVITTERAWLVRAVGLDWTVPALQLVWEKSQAKGNLPAWFSPTGSTERGLGYGKVSNNERLYIVSRNAGTNVRVINANTGNDIGLLDMTGVTGGTYFLNDVGVTLDGKILACNLSNSLSDTFRVYMWNDETSAPVKVVDYVQTTFARLGDKITITGDFANNTAVIWAASSTTANAKVFRWTMTGGAFNAVPEEITLSDATVGSTASVGPIPGNGFYLKSNGQSVKHYSMTGQLLGTVPGTVVATGANAIRWAASMGGNDYFAVFQYGAGNQNARVVGVPMNDYANSFTYGLTPPLGVNSNANGTGDIDIRRNTDGSVDVFVMATNNGFGVYHTTQAIPVELTAFAATVTGNDVTLNWTTATEVNNSGFSIERKELNGQYKSIAFVEGNGNTTELTRYSYTDKSVTAGAYIYRLKQMDYDGTFSYSNEVKVDVSVPNDFSLAQNYPNPFNPSTVIKYAVPVDGMVTLSVYNVLGQKVATLVNEIVKAGTYEVSFDASKFSTGIYIYKMESGKFSSTKKMMLVK
ncbi:MAG: choice-of-anchor D domain-containing protein [Ignavibacteriaceae bacterium]|nr:choice-of-anchor D domain-containing protein [Ignavibacteriaceae bacterium]